MQTPIESLIRSLALIHTSDNHDRFKDKPFDAMMEAYIAGFNKATEIHKEAVKNVLSK